MGKKISTKTLNNAVKRYERAKLQAKIDMWRGKEIATQDPVKREEARMKRIQYERAKQLLRIRRNSSGSGR